MATYAYLVDPNKQFMTKSGTINVNGSLRVYDASTDDAVITYKDFNGTENEESIRLDNNGRAVVIADSARVYRLEVYDRYGSLQWTVSPLWCLAAGGGASISSTEIISTNGSIDIDKVTIGSATTFDIKVAEDSTNLLEWIRCDGAVKHSDTYVPVYAAGTMRVGHNGLLVSKDRYYHFTAHLRASKGSVQPFYDKVDILFRLLDNNNVETNVVRQSVIVDSSLGLVQDFEVSADVMVEEDAELILDILNTSVQGITWEVLNFEAHRIFSGAPVIPGGIVERSWVEENFQPTLTAGQNIVIDENNVISATAAPQQQANWAETDTTSVQYIQNKPDLSQYATQSDLAGKQDVLTAGQNITIDANNVISADAAPQLQSNWTEADNTSVQYIQNKPVEKSLVAGANISITEGTTDVTISATADPQVQADWTQSNSAAVDYIKHKPNLAAVATSGSYTDLSNTPSIPSIGFIDL